MHIIHKYLQQLYLLLSYKSSLIFKNIYILQLSYADTHPMFSITDFPNFFRVVPSENAFNAPRLALLRHFNWTRVGTIYQNEPRYALVSIHNIQINFKLFNNC